MPIYRFLSKGLMMILHCPIVFAVYLGKLIPDVLLHQIWIELHVNFVQYLAFEVLLMVDVGFAFLEIIFSFHTII